MPAYEYKVVPAPRRGQKARNVKGVEAQFAHALSILMNDLGREGWEYLRADTLPCEERVGLTGRQTTYQNLLVFRRTLPDKATPAPETKPEPVVTVPAPAAIPAPIPVAPPTASADPLPMIEPVLAPESAPEAGSEAGPESAPESPPADKPETRPAD